MKRKHTPNKMQNIASFFTKSNHSSQQNSSPNEQISTPHHANQQPSSPTHNSPQNSTQNSTHNFPQNEVEQCSSLNALGSGVRLSENDFANLPHLTTQRRKMSDFHPDDRDLVRRTYIQKGPCQPKNHVFPQRLIKHKKRRFCVKWFDSWSSWLEYSVEKDAAYCFICYLFKDDNAFRGDEFVIDGFRSWNKSDIIKNHVGKHMSAHNNALVAMDFFKKQKSSITTALSKQNKESMSNYRKRLEASIIFVQWLLVGALSFQGHDEKETSSNRGNYLRLLALVSELHLDYAKVCLKNAPSNCQLTSSSVQKDIINACAKETTKAILEDLNGGFFAILAHECVDIFDKEHMAICLRYVNEKGEVCERLLGIVHVGDTSSLTLKDAIESLLIEHNLSFSQVRGQGYDGASNMQGSINGLKTLIEKECKQAYFIHCFAHQLHLTQVALVRKNRDCAWLFSDMLAPLMNFVGDSPKRKEFLREKQAQAVVDALSLGERETGSGLNQERVLCRPFDTRWSFHFKTIANVLDLFPAILGSLDDIAKVANADDFNRATSIIYWLMTFDFVFMAHLMVAIFAITNELNIALQKHEQDIVNAMAMVNVTKTNLQKFRDEGWDSFMEKVLRFTTKYEIEVPNMDAAYVIPHRRMYRGKLSGVSYLHHFRVEVFISVIDLQLQELENRFPEISKELLVCMSCFSPVNRFSSFDQDKLIKLATFYPNEFSSSELIFFKHTLQNFIITVREDERFWNLKNLSELSKKLVETGLSETHSRVYLLLKLVLVLPVATASVERVFSGMTFVKDKLRNSVGDQMLNDCLITFLESDLFCNVKVDDIIDQYQNMKTRCEQL